MNNRTDRYDKEERRCGRGAATDGWKVVGGILAAVLVMVFAGVFASIMQEHMDGPADILDGGPEGQEVRIRNVYLRRMNVQCLEHVASTTKLRREREEALYLLYNVYVKRSVRNLYDYAVRYRGELFPDKAMAIAMERSDSMYQVALHENTEQAWSDVMAYVPEEFQRDAEERYNALHWVKTANLWDTEEKAWEQVMAQKGRRAFHRYVKLYPDGCHATEARRKLRMFEREEAIRQKNMEYDRIRYRNWLKRMGR